MSRLNLSPGQPEVRKSRHRRKTNEMGIQNDDCDTKIVENAAIKEESDDKENGQAEHAENRQADDPKIGNESEQKPAFLREISTAPCSDRRQSFIDGPTEHLVDPSLTSDEPAHQRKSIIRLPTILKGSQFHRSICRKFELKCKSFY